MPPAMRLVEKGAWGWNEKILRRDDKGEYSLAEKSEKPQPAQPATSTTPITPTKPTAPETQTVVKGGYTGEKKS